MTAAEGLRAARGRIEVLIGANVYQTAGRMGGVEGTEGPITEEVYLICIRNIVDIGFNQVELILDPLYMSLSAKELKRLVSTLLNFKEQTGVTYSVHLPFWWIDISNPLESLRRSSVDTVRSAVQLTRSLRPEQYVLHVLKDIPSRIQHSGGSQRVKASMVDRVLAAAATSLREILSDFDNSRTLCIENTISADFDLDSRLAEEFDTSICFDIGHQFIAERDVMGFIDRFYCRIRSIHAHNVMTGPVGGWSRLWRVEDHLSLADGLIDYQKVLVSLTEHGYKGSLIVEVKTEVDARKSMEFLKKLRLI